MIGYLSCDLTTTTLRLKRGSSFDRDEVIGAVVVLHSCNMSLRHELRLLKILVRSDTWRDCIGFEGERTKTGGGLRVAIGEWRF